MRQRTGLAFSASRLGDAEAATLGAMRRAGIADARAYRSALEAGEADLDDLVARLTIHETYFFRESAHFSILRATALPAIVGRTAPDHVLRVWSAGCSTGEEAYSLAILLEEAGLAHRSRVLGTDISKPVLDRARAGRYRAWSLRSIDDATARRYFATEGEDRVLDARFPRRVTFAPHNLADASYPWVRAGIWGFDVIFCRNVLVYLDQATVRQVARRFFDALTPGGFLFTSASDPPLADDAPFVAMLTEGGVVYRRPEPHVREEDGDGRPRSTMRAALPPPPSPPPDAPRSAPRAESPPRRLDDARAAFAAGEWARAAQMAGDADDPELAALCVRAAANLGEVAQAALRCREAVARHPLSVELHYLHAVLLAELGRLADASDAARRVVYLDPSSAPGYFLLGSILQRAHELGGAARAYRNARDLANERPIDEEVPLGEGERAGALAIAASAALGMLDAAGGLP